MKRYFSFILSVFLLIFLVISCSKGGSGDGGGGTGGGGGGTGPGTACSGTAGQLFTAVKNILQTNCVSCHGGSSPQSGINFADNCTIVNQKNNIKNRAVDQAGTPNQMPPPPSQPLTVQERQTITNWINAGGRFTD